MPPLDRLERLTDLVLVLLDASTPRTLDEIAHAVPGYPESREARRQAFERDKRLLREEGIPVATEPVDGPEQFGYRIDPDAFYLPDMRLEPEEEAALHLAVAGVHLGDPSGRDALAKLGAAGVGEARPLAALDPPAALVALFAALRAHAEVRFSYHGETRVVAPATVRFHHGRWYLVGWDRDRQAPRTFRIDRVEGAPNSGPPGSGQLPEQFAGTDPVLDPWRPVDDDVDQVLLLVDHVEAARVVAEVGEQAVERRSPDGSVVLRLGTTTPAMLRSWILSLLDHAEIVGPPDARAAMVDWLQSMAGDRAAIAGARAPATSAIPIGAALAAEGARGTDADGPPARMAQPATGKRVLPASVRLRRLLAMVAWLADVGEASIPDVARRFGLDEDEVVRELELAACCGVPPYTPDALLEIAVTEDTVQAYLPRALSRPRRLTPAEGFALAASARTILAVPGADAEGALARAVAKLDGALGDHRGLVVDVDAPEHLAAVRALADAGSRAEIEYHSASNDETTVRVIDPLAVRLTDGHWYLDAHCHRAGGVRRFRVDRMSRVTAIDPHTVTASDGSRGSPPGDPSPLPADDTGNTLAPAAFVPGPGAVPVRLLLHPAARWVLEAVPVLEWREGPTATVDVVLAVGGTAWLERLLLQLGPDASVVDPEDLRDLGRQAALRVRRRYT